MKKSLITLGGGGGGGGQAYILYDQQSNPTLRLNNDSYIRPSTGFKVPLSVE